MKAACASEQTGNTQRLAGETPIDPNQITKVCCHVCRVGVAARLGERSRFDIHVPTAGLFGATSGR